MIQRNDVCIAIHADGSVYAAQGPVAEADALDGSVADSECCLWYSQLRHRDAVRLADGTLRIMYPSRVPDDAIASLSLAKARGCRLTGSAVRVGEV